MMIYSYDPASLQDIPDLTEKIEAALEEIDCPMKAVMQIDVAIDEIYSNIVNYGYRAAEGRVEVRLETDPGFVRVTFIDEAPQYDPLAADDPDTTLSMEERGIGGLGVFIVKKTMDDVKYSYENGKNIFMIQKNI